MALSWEHRFFFKCLKFKYEFNNKSLLLCFTFLPSLLPKYIHLPSSLDLNIITNSLGFNYLIKI